MCERIAPLLDPKRRRIGSIINSFRAALVAWHGSSAVLGSRIMDAGSKTSSALMLEAEVNVQPEADFRFLACTAELAECTCPEYCERGHDAD